MRSGKHKWLGLAPAALVIAAVVVATAGAQTGGAGGATGHSPKSHHAARTLAGTTSYNVSFRLQGCDLPVATTLPISGKFICPDADYSDGNLGKNWNELDLVPHRILITAGTNAPATQTYTFQIAADYSQTKNGVTAPGYDLIENGFEATSSACQNVQLGAQNIDGTVPADQTIWRSITVTQAAGTTCQLDLWLRLAVGAHLFPGSSLHSYLLNDGGTSIGDTSGIGQKTNSIPTNEIEPQSISKDMLAQRDTDHTWNVTKSATPASLDFGDICSSTTFPRTQGVSVTVTWTKGAATPSGQTTITTNIYANNPSHRVIDVGVTDVIYAGTTQTTQIDSHTFAAVPVAANTNGYLIATHTVSTSDTSTHFNDVATATYIDDVANVPVPGSTTATAGADVATGDELNASATISDSESITTGKNLSFKVTSPTTGYVAPSEAGALLAYTAGDYTVGPVNWSSGSQSDSGSQVFAKTVKMDPGILLGSGDAALTDQATITGSDGFSAQSDLLSVGITSSRTTSLTIDKSVPTALATGQSVTFHFTVKNSGGSVVATPSIAFGAGDSDKTVTVNGLGDDTYTVSEDAPTGTTSTGWTLAPNTNVDLTAACSGTANMDNTYGPATLTAGKVTDPTTDTINNVSYEAGWTFTLAKGGTTIATGTSDNTGAIKWGVGAASSVSISDAGTYTVTETGQTGWTRTNTNAGSNGTVTSGGACQFVVVFPDNAGTAYNCTITNQSRGHVRVVKAINGAPITGSQTFQFQLRAGDQHTTSTDPLETLTANSTNGGTLNFVTGIKPGQTYAMCELLVAAYNPTINGYGPYNPTDNANYWCWNFSMTPSDTVNTLVFNVENDHPTSKALTIGYWKNWTSCKNSKGKQADVLGQYLGGITLGTYTFTNSSSDECKAVQTLSKNTFGGVNKSSDPLFNMAAQLLAADLNINAQAGVCSALVTAVNGGQALLVKYGWNGNTYSPALTAADATLANGYATTLDKYNNNQLC